MRVTTELTKSGCFYFSLVLILCQMVSVTWASATPNPWAKATQPASGAAESIGSPGAGCLRGAVKLNEDAMGVYLMRPQRGRSYGHPHLVQLIQTVGREFANKKAPPILIGDIGQPKGGPTMSAHASHQNGLDIDIWYFRPKSWIGRRVSLKQRAKLSAVGMVDKKHLKVNDLFESNQVELLRAFAEKPEVDRILVNFSIKRYLCLNHSKEAWIRKIRPWFGHDSHFHLRLKCDAKDISCKNGEDIPHGNGCDSSLDWWWSDEARQEEKKNFEKQSAPVMPTLPSQCDSVLSM
jgi:penicillin-insensitive murein endopeptidase